MKKLPFFLICISFLVAGSIHALFAQAGAKPSDFGLKEGDMISASDSSDPDIYIINEQGYKRLFLNPVIFNYYGHLGGFPKVKKVTPQIRDAFSTSALFRNCEENDTKIHAIKVIGEDEGELQWVNVGGTTAQSEDPAFFNKVFCVNNREFNWYKKGATLTSVKNVTNYDRPIEHYTTDIKPLPSPTPTPALVAPGPLPVVTAIQKFFPVSEAERRDRRRVFLLKTLALHLEKGKKEKGSYPISKTLVKFNDSSTNVIKQAINKDTYQWYYTNKSFWDMPFFLDPLPGYFFGYVSDGKSYTLTAKLESSKSCGNVSSSCLFALKGPLTFRSETPDYSNCDWVIAGKDGIPGELHISLTNLEYNKDKRLNLGEVEDIIWKEGADMSPWNLISNPNFLIGPTYVMSVSPANQTAVISKLKEDKDKILYAVNYETLFSSNLW